MPSFFKFADANENKVKGELLVTGRSFRVVLYGQIRLGAYFITCCVKTIFNST